MSDRLNLGELRGRGVLLFTREAAAVLHEVCRHLSDAEAEGRPLAAPTSRQLWVTEAGELVVDAEPANPGENAQSTMAGMAALIEAVLPPTMRNQPDYAVPGSFRVLAPRARGFPPGLPPIGTPAELDAAINRYRSGDTTRILEELFRRIAGVPAAVPVPVPASEPEPILAPEPEPIAGSSEESADAVRPELAVVESGAPDRGPELDLRLRVDDSLDDGLPWVQPLPPSPTTRRSADRARLWLIAAAAILLAFFVGYEATRRTMPRSELTARAHEPVESTSERVQAAAPARRPVSVGPIERQVARAAASPAASSQALPRAATRKTRDASDANDSGGATDAADATDAGTAPLEAPAPLEMPASTGPVFSPSFAASGSALVFHAGRDPVARLMSADIGGPSSPLELVTMVSDNARNYHPRLSPDGNLLAFDSDRDGERGVYIANRDGSQVRRVSGAGFAAVPSWSPDMHAVSFVRAEQDRPQVWNLWRLDRTTGALVRLTHHRYGQTWGASWFPDSRRLCYSHEDRLIVLDVEDGSSRVFKSPHPGRLVRTPAVSPDGRLVAFQVLRSGVWLLDLESGAMRRLIEDPSAEEFAWDPNGGRLAYHSRQSGEWRIWIAAAPREVADAR